VQKVRFLGICHFLGTGKGMINNIHEQLADLVVPIENLEVLEGNPRKGDVEAGAKSYRTFGQRKPVVARKTGSNGKGDIGVVLAGNHQLKAALDLGWTEIAVVFVEDDDKTAAAFALADNRVSDLGEYDANELSQVLEEMKATPELLIAASFDVDDLGAAVKDQIEIDNMSTKNDKENNKKKKSLADMADEYQNRSTRTFRAEYPYNVYNWLISTLENYKEDKGVESTTTAFIEVLKNIEGEKKK
jgi:hypothetical protein